MKTQISIPVPTDQFLDLAEFLRENRDPRDPVEVICNAIDYWIDNASWKPELLRQPKTSSLGYIWKELFLPQGTEIRMTYKGTIYRAAIVEDQFVHDGVASSPGSMVNTVSGTSRSAWRDLWIRRPNDSEWISAERCRDQARQSVP